MNMPGSAISEKKRLLLYIGILIGVSFIWEGAMLFIGGITGPYFFALGFVLMYFPAIAAMIYLAVTKQGFRWMGFSLGKKRYMVYAVVLPILVSVLSIWLAVGTGFATQSIFSYNDGMVLSWATGTAPVPAWAFVMQFLSGITIGILITSVLTFGEELGWRGFLQNKLIKEFGLLPGVLLLGTIWGFWHAPIIYAGYNFPGYPLLGSLVLMPLFCIGTSGVLAWLTLRAGSLWPAVLAHASINSVVGPLINMPQFEIEPFNRYLLFVGAWLILGVLAIIHLKRTEGTGAWGLYLPEKQMHDIENREMPVSENT